MSEFYVFTYCYYFYVKGNWFDRFLIFTTTIDYDYVSVISQKKWCQKMNTGEIKFCVNSTKIHGCIGLLITVLVTLKQTLH